MAYRLATIDGDDGYAVLSRNTVTSLAHRGTVPYRRLDKNNFVQLEDTTIKTERVCSMRNEGESCITAV